MNARSLRRRPWLVGAAAVGIYFAVALAMLTVGDHRVLPLFEGVGPPAKYQWVNPPSQFAAGNVKPTASTQDIPITGGKSALTTVSSSDGQFIASLPDGAFGANGSDTSVRAVVTPLDPGTLGPPPSGLASDGNAYRIEFTYQPSGGPIAALSSAGSLVMNAPHQAEVVLFSRDSRSWFRLASQPAGGLSSIGAAFTAPGWYQVGANPAVVTGSKSSSSSSGTIVIAIGAGVLALIAAFFAVREARRRRAKPARPHQGRRPGPPRQSPLKPRGKPPQKR
jgi:hypothetical protein